MQIWGMWPLVESQIRASFGGPAALDLPAGLAILSAAGVSSAVAALLLPYADHAVMTTLSARREGGA